MVRMVFRGVGRSLVMMVFLALMLVSAPLDRHGWAAAGGSELPVLGTLPLDGSQGVRPDTSVVFYLDTKAQEFRPMREQFEKGRYAVVLTDGAGQQVYLGTSDQAVFNPKVGTLSVTGLSLNRYAEYSVTLAVKAAYEAVLHGHPLPSNEWVSFAFRTGSALHEPTHYQLTVDNPSPRVTEAAGLTLYLTDDYGNPAWGADVALTFAETGQRLPGSAAATPPGAAAGPADNGWLTFGVTDQEAEQVTVTVTAAGAYPENGWTGSAALAFRPGLPAAAELDGVPAEAEVGTALTVTGRVVDKYGNPVEDGTPLQVGGVGSATVDGAFQASVALPARTGSFLLNVEYAGRVLATREVRLLAGPPAAVNEVTVPPTVQAGQAFTVCGLVVDAYGNPVGDGTVVSGGGAATTTQNGQFCLALTAPTAAGSSSITVTAGSVTYTVPVTTVAADPASLTLAVTLPVNTQNGSVPADGTSKATLTATVMDAYGNPVSGAAVNWSKTLGTLSSTSTTTTQNGQAVVDLTSTQAGTATVTASVGGLSKSATVTFGTPGGIPAKVTGLSYSQSWVDARYVNYGYGSRFRAKQGMNLNVSGRVLGADNQPVANSVITVYIQTEGTNTRSATVTTNSNGDFTASVYVSYGYGRRIYTTFTSYHHWDWGYVTVKSGSATLASDSIYAFAYSIYRPH